MANSFGKWPLIRAGLLTITFLGFYAAIPFVSLSTLGAAIYLAPIFVALMSAYAIKEPVGPLGWLGVLLGFAGVLVLLQPGTESFSGWALLPVAGAGFYALANIITRVKCQAVPLPALSFSQMFGMMMGGLIFSFGILVLQPSGPIFDANPYIFGSWATLSADDWGVLALLAGLSILISLLLAGAYKVAPPTVVSTFEYSYLVFVAIWDMLFFSLAPTLATASGMVMIVVAGLLVLNRKPG